MISHNLVRVVLLVAVVSVSARTVSARCNSCEQDDEARILVGPNVHVSKDHPDLAHYEVILAADPNDPHYLLAGSMISYTQDGKSPPQSLAYWSADGGRTWHVTLERKEDLRANDPWVALGPDPAVAFGPDGSAYFAALPLRTMGIPLFRSHDHGKSWEQVATVGPGISADRPFLALDHSGGKYHGRLYCNCQFTPPMLDETVARWLPKVSGYAVHSSEDRGSTFHDLTAWRIANPPYTGTGCSNLLVLSDGTLVAPYSVVDKSDPENANVGKGVGKGIEQRPWAVGPGRSVLCVLRSVDGGRSFERGARISKWDRSGVACFTVSPQRADGKQRLYAAWSDIRGERHHVLLSYSSDKGLTWSKPAVVSDDTGAREKDVDAFLPAIAVNKNGVVGVSWYDTRELPSGRTGWDVRFRATLDEAKTWLPSVRVSEKSSVFKGGSGPLGDTAGLAADAEGVFHVLWVDHRTGVQQAWTAEVSVGTKKSPDHQARADAASWDFSPDAASLKKSITGFPKPYQVEPSPDDVGNATITITKEGKALYRWSGHTASVFLAAADVLYYADYSRDATGCRLIAVDLKNGKELWKTRLKGLGPIRHSRYSNQVNLRLEDMAMLRITSLESAGGYLEFVDRRTGKTVGHRVFSSKERE